MVKQKLLNLLSALPRGLNALARRHELARARRQGMRVGDNTRFVGTQYFGTEPYLVVIGSDGLITDRVTFITHDGGIQVPFIRDGLSSAEVYGRKSIFGSVTVGNNCLIGVVSILLAGTEIGDNSVIGAGSIVRGRFDPGSVIAGNPARAVSTVDRYFEKNGPNVIEFTGSESLDERARIILSHGTE